ncbi:thioredoxin [Nitratifractor sp.]
MALENLTTENFNEKVQNHQIAILDFWAPWCGPCRSFAPVFEKVAQEYPEILFGKINTEEEQELGAYFQVRSIPTLMVIKEGVVVFNQAGALPEDALKEIVEQAKALDMDKVREEIAKAEAEGKKQ